MLINDPKSIHDKFLQFPLTPDDKTAIEAARIQASVDQLKKDAQQERSWALLGRCVQDGARDRMNFWQEKTFIQTNGERRVLREVYYDEYGGIDLMFHQGVPVRCEIKNIETLRKVF